MKLKAKALSTILTVSCLLIAGSPTSVAQTTACQENKPVLGVVELGSTTLTQFQESMKAKGCKFDAKDDSVVVAPGCFKLPGNPEVTVQSPDKSGIIGIC